MYFLRRLNSFKVNRTILADFYRATIESVLAKSILVWGNSANVNDIKKLDRVVKNASYIIGDEMDKMQVIYEKRAANRTNNIMVDPSHPAHSMYKLMPSGRRLRSHKSGTERFLNSFFPSTIRFFNEKNK